MVSYVKWPVCEKQQTNLGHFHVKRVASSGCDKDIVYSMEKVTRK